MNRFSSAARALLGAATLASCTSNTVGVPPPAHTFHYPIAAAVSPDARWMYVVSSDFNLKYSGGLVNAVDLAQVRALIAGGQHVVGNGGDESGLVVSSVRIGPFATSAALGRNGTRLYVNVRGDGTLTWIDAVDGGGRLSCGNASDGDACDTAHMPGHDENAPPRDLIEPPLPTSLSVGADGFIAVTHQEVPRARLSVYRDPTDATTGPQLVWWVRDLSPNLNTVLRIDDPTASPGATVGPYWWALSRAEPVVNHVRAVAAPQDPHEPAFAYRADLTPLPGVPNALGIRGIVRDPCDRNRAFATARPSGGFTNNYVSDQLLEIDLTDPTQPTVTDTLSLPPGPSNLVAFPRTGTCAPGVPTVAYAISYDSRRIYAIDTAAWREIDEIRTASGPHIPIVDPLFGQAGHGYLYVLDFVAMVVEVIDVDAASPTYNQVVFTLGDVNAPETTL